MRKDSLEAIEIKGYFDFDNGPLWIAGDPHTTGAPEGIAACVCVYRWIARLRPCLMKLVIC